MSKEVLCPRCGLGVAIDPPPEAIPIGASVEATRTVELTLPVTTEDFSIRFDPPTNVHHASAYPNGSIGVFVAGDAGPSAQTPALDVESGSNDAILFGELDPLLGAFVPPSADLDATEEHAIRAFPADHGPSPFGALNLESRSPTRPADPAAEDEAEEDGADARAGISLGAVLLASYASAITLALAYVLWSHRDRGPSGPETMPADSRPDLGAEGPRAIEPASPIPPDHLGSIGRALRVGSLEITPQEVVGRPVRLVHRDPDAEEKVRMEPGDALQLLLRIKNLGAEPLAPIEASLVRAPDQGFPETYIESGRGDRIDPFPLAINSEWSIAGQPFDPIAPGKTAKVLIVSDREVGGRIADPLIWRIRLRTTANRVETIGVRFGKAEIR